MLKNDKWVDFFLQFVYITIRIKCLPFADGVGDK